MKERLSTGADRRSIGILRLGVGRRFNPDGSVGGNHRVAILLNAVHERLGLVTKAQRRLEGVAVLEIAEGEVRVHLFGNGIDAVFDCDGFHVLYFLLFVVLCLRKTLTADSHAHAQGQPGKMNKAQRIKSLRLVEFGFQ